MKIQCPCGTKYAFDVTPEMGQSPIRFVCQNCGADSSALVNQLIRQQLGLEAPAAAARPAVAPAPVIVPPPAHRPSAATAVPAAPVVRVAATASSSPAAATASPVALPVASAPPLRVSAPAASAAAAAPEVAAPQICNKHVGQLTTHRCLVCQKPICPQCMQLFGFVCSAYCKGKAENQGMDIPVYAGQRDVAQSREWRKVGLVTMSVGAVVAVVVGVWGWYAWVGSVPKVAFSVRMPEPAYYGQVRVCAQDQIVFLHGGTLARHDMKAKKEIWSNLLIDKKAIADEATKQFEEQQVAREKFRAAGGNLAEMAFVTREEYLESLERSATAVLHLYVRGENIWVSSPGRFTRYDWQTGKPDKEIPLSEELEEPLTQGEELLFLSHRFAGEQTLTRFNLSSGESRVEEFAPGTALAGKSSAAGKSAAKRTGTNQVAGAAAQEPKPLDPAAIASRVQNMSKPARLALPAVLAANANQQRLQTEMRDQEQPAGAALRSRPASRELEEEPARLIVTRGGVVQLTSRLLETKIVQRKAMKDPPKKSALDGPINQAATAAIANELLNEMARERGADVVEENQSRYQVTVRRPGAKESAEWTGEVTGLPNFISLQTVDVVTGGKSIIVLDKSMKKLWEAQLAYDVSGGFNRDGDEQAPSAGHGPCAERGDTLYVYDAGVLTAFDLASGTVRWRLPTVGTTGLFFDDQGMIYVNTSSATPDNLKYSNQIDVTEKVHPVALKVEPKTGATLWRANNDGMISYISGKLVYTVESHQGDDDDADGLIGIETVFHVPPHIRIRRLDAGNGRVLWQHYQKRCPLDVRFDKNSIHLLFKKEAQVLKYILL
jgi:hypothetical protein